MAVERVIAVDWSGARSGPQVWMAEVDDGRVTRLEPTGSRERAVAAVVRASGEGRRVAVGFDFAFSYPAWFVEDSGCADVFELWDFVAREGERWLARPGYPFWLLRTRGQGETGERAFRRTERETAGVRVSPKSTFQVAGPGQVGTMSVRGIPLLRDLRRGGLAVWPFEAPAPGQSVVVEIYPRRYYGDRVVKGDPGARAEYLAPYRAQLSADQWRAAVDPEQDHAFDALTAALTMWRSRSRLASLPLARDYLERLEGRIWEPGL